VRPLGRAVRKARHNMIIGGKGTPGGLGGTRSGEAKGVITGVRSPPLQGGQARHEWPCKENPETTRAVVFSEGCAPRVRVARPYSCRGLSLPKMGASVAVRR
jgi:hypothetical protein